MLFLLENMGLRVSISGCGKVIYQSIAEGTHVQKRHAYTLNFKLINYETTIRFIKNNPGYSNCQ